MDDVVLTFLDLLGVFAFSMYGAHKAITARFDLLGVLLCGALTAFGGGTIRELIVNGTPVYLHNYHYLVAALLGVTGALIIHKSFAKIEHHLLILDAIGIAIFAYVGAYRAETAGLGLAAMVFFAVVSAAGGGIVTDIISGRRPEALYKDFYPLAAIVLAIEYYYVRPENSDISALVLIGSACAVRLISVHYKRKLWQPYKNSSQKNMTRLRKLIPAKLTSS